VNTPQNPCLYIKFQMMSLGLLMLSASYFPPLVSCEALPLRSPGPWEGGGKEERKVRRNQQTIAYKSLTRESEFSEMNELLKANT